MNLMTAPESQSGSAPDEDIRYMRAALALGTREMGRTWPNPAVGALVVKDGVVVGRGWTKIGGRPHAERVALAEAGDEARGATLYVSLEPCSHHGRTPPCADAIVESGVARVVSTIEDPNPLIGGQGYKRLRDAGIEVVDGVCAHEAEKVHAGHLFRIVHKRPYVTLKLAVSANGKAALAGRKPAPITGAAARDLVHRMRSKTDAIAAGIGTVLADDPLLTVRLPGMEDRSPVRVIFDSAIRLPLTSQIVVTARQVPVWVMADTGASREAELMLAPHGIEVLRCPLDTDGIDLRAVVKHLYEKGITTLMVEGGPLLAAAFLKAGLVDAATIFQSPDRLGEDALDALPEPYQEALPKAGLNLRGTHRAGEDTLFLYERD